MENVISYNVPVMAKQVSAFSVTTSEVEVFNLTDLTFPKKSQVSLYFDLDLSGGTITSVKFRLFFAFTNAGTIVWYPVPVQNLSTGQLVDTPVVIDSTAYTYTSGKYREVFDIPFSAATAIRVTAQGVGSGTATLNTLTLMVRDN